MDCRDAPDTQQCLPNNFETEITAFEAEEDEESEGPALEPAPGLMDGGRTQYPREHE